MITMVDTMQAMVITAYGGVDVFKLQGMPKPKPKEKELLVKVFATSVNPIDYKIRGGLRATGLKLPQILGFDVSGVIEEIGDKVTEFKVGDEVYYLPRIIGWQGSYAEYHLVEEEIVSRKPANLSHSETAGIPLVASTSWDALIGRLKIKLGETVLIHAGAGGVGSIAIQLAKLCGTFVFATCSTKNIDFVKKLGADFVIDYRKQNFVDVIFNETKNEGVDVVFDTVGGENLTKSLEATKRFGRVATILPITSSVEMAFFKNISIHPVFVQSGRYKLDIIRDLLEWGKLKPVIDSVVTLSEIPKAHEKLEAGGVRGKIVVEITKK